MLRLIISGAIVFAINSLEAIAYRNMPLTMPQALEKSIWPG